MPVILLLLTGAAAGTGTGYVLQRGGLCFHAMFAGAWEGPTTLLRGWLLGVTLAAVGLSVLYLLPWSDGLNRGLAFRPVGNVGGGLLVGFGMAVARSCVSGLFFKLGAGMLGAAVGLAGWAVGELLASRVTLPGPTVLGGGDTATIPHLIGVPRLGLSLVLAAVMGVVWWRSRSTGAVPEPGSDTDATWSWPVLGLGLGAVTVAAWLLAAAGGASYGPSTVGAVAGIADGRPPWWLIGFLVALVLGGHLAARTTGTLRVRGEARPRYLQLGVGGVLLGAGGWFAGGCNLGHGVSGVAQLNVSSWVAVVAMALGVGLGRRVLRSVAGDLGDGRAVEVGGA